MKRKSRKRKEKKKASATVIIVTAAVMIALGLIGGNVYRKYLYIGKKTLSDQVLAYRELVAEHASAHGLEKYIDYFLAIMQVESGGNGKDVMQSSESADLAPNTLEPEESIEQACVYFEELLEYKDRYGVDLNTLIQAYNYGPNYMRYVRDNGGRHTDELAEAFAEEKSGGRKTAYRNSVAIRANGGWRYAYGNMFYVKLVEQYLP